MAMRAAWSTTVWKPRWCIAVLVLVAAACSTSSATNTSADASVSEVVDEGIDPGAGGDADPDSDVDPNAGFEGDDPVGAAAADIVSCNGRAFSLSALDTIEPLSQRPEIVEAVAPFLESGEGEFWPQAGWQVVTISDTEAMLVILQTEAEVREQLEQIDGVSVDDTFGDGVDDGINMSLQTAEFRDGSWVWAGSSAGADCELETPAPAGLNRVEWELDSDAGELIPETTTLHLLAHERACTGGEAMGDRLNEPELVETDQAVLISMTAVPLEGETFTCPGNPYAPVVIELAAPLGERDLRDGSQTAGFLSDYIGDVFGLQTER